MARENALGQGLDALFPSGGLLSQSSLAFSQEVGEDVSGVLNIPLDKISSSKNQPRKAFEKEALIELAESIKSSGVIQPVIVERDKGDSDRFIIIAGERRYRASKLAKLESIPALIREVDDSQRLEIMLIENIQREDLSPLEEATAYDTMVKELGYSQQEVADKVGKKRSTIANSLRLLKLPEVMRTALSSSAITSGHARALLMVNDDENRLLLFNRIIKEQLSVRRAEKEADSLNAKGTFTDDKPFQKVLLEEKKVDSDFAALQEQLIEHLGTRVKFSGSFEKGKIEISYFSQDDLSRLMELLKVNN